MIEYSFTLELVHSVYLKVKFVYIGSNLVGVGTVGGVLSGLKSFSLDGVNVVSKMIVLPTDKGF